MGAYSRNGPLFESWVLIRGGCVLDIPVSRVGTYSRETLNRGRCLIEALGTRFWSLCALLPRTRHIFIFYFFSSIVKKANTYGKKIRYITFITLVQYDKKWWLFTQQSIFSIERILFNILLYSLSLNTKYKQ